MGFGTLLFIMSVCVYFMLVPLHNIFDTVGLRGTIDGAIGKLIHHVGKRRH